MRDAFNGKIVEARCCPEWASAAHSPKEGRVMGVTWREAKEPSGRREAMFATRAARGATGLARCPPKLWRKIKGKNPITGGRMNHAIFIAAEISGELAIGDKREIDRAEWRDPTEVPLTSSTRYVCDHLLGAAVFEHRTPGLRKAK
jgi:hypothetical protein